MKDMTWVFVVGVLIWRAIIMVSVGHRNHTERQTLVGAPIMVLGDKPVYGCVMQDKGAGNYIAKLRSEVLRVVDIGDVLIGEGTCDL